MAITDIFRREQPVKQDNFENVKESFLTVKQTCEMLQTTPETLRRWEKLGKITPYFLTPPEQRVKASDYRGKRYRLSDINKLLIPGSEVN